MITQQSFSYAHKFERYSFYQLIDKEESFNLIKKKLAEFLKTWREDRQNLEGGLHGTHGGITGNHMGLIRVLLRILPCTMEDLRGNRPNKFKALVAAGKFIVITKRPSLCTKLLEAEGISVGNKTITNLIKRLKEADVVLNCKARVLDGIEIELNPELISLFITAEELQAEELEAALGEQAPEQGSEHINNESGVEGTTPGDRQVGTQGVHDAGENWELFRDKMQDFVKNENSGLAESPGPKNSFFPPYIKLNKELIKDQERDAVSVDTDNPLSNKKVIKNGPTKSSLERRGPEFLLLRQLINSLFKDFRFDEAVVRKCLDLIRTNLRAAKGVVQDWRSSSIREVQKTETFKKIKNKAKFLEKFRNKHLPDTNRAAFELVSAAIQIQKEYIEKKNYNFFMHPVKYLAQKFEIPMSYAKDQMIKNFLHPVDNMNIHAQAVARAEVWRAVSNMSLVALREKTSATKLIDLYSIEYNRIRKLLSEPEFGELSIEEKESYLTQLKDQLNNLFQ